MAQGPIPNSYWLAEGSVCCGEYPGAKQASEVRRKLGLLLDAGIRSFVDLTENQDGLEPYDALLREEAARRDIEASWFPLGVRDNSVPTKAHMARILECIDEQVRRGQAVYIHCWGGVGRTGTVAGCYLVRCGQSGAEALEVVASRWDLMTEEKRRRHNGSPETGEQRRFVLDWREEAHS